MCPFLDAPNLGKLFERGNARLIGHEVFAVTHDLDPQRRPFIRYRSADDELNGLVFEYLLLTAH